MTEDLVFMAVAFILIVDKWSAFSQSEKIYLLIVVPALVLLYAGLISYERVTEWRAERRQSA